MKEKVKYPGMVILLLLLFTGNTYAHKFYVSLCQISYKSDSSQLQIVMKLFTDDLEKAIWHEEGVMIKAGTAQEREDSDSLVSVYLLRHFKILIRGKKIPVHYLGKEVSYDVTWCYLESFPEEVPHELTVESDLLTEVYPSQINLIEVSLDGRKKGMMLNRDKRNGTLRFR